MSRLVWIEKLKNRWIVKSAGQVIVILIVFACTRFSVMFLKPLITDLLYGEEKSTLFSLLYWVLILPIYNLLLLFSGFIFGQFNFFWEFDKRLYGRLFRSK